jgi:hypothetical protein
VPIDNFKAEDSKYIIIISGKCPSKILEGGSQKVEPPPDPPPPDLLRLNSFIYQLIALNLRIPIIKSKMRLIVDVQKLQKLAPPANNRKSFGSIRADLRK